MKKVLCLLVAVLMMTAVPSQAMTRATDLSSAGEFPIVSEPITLTVTVEGDTTYLTDSNYAINYIREKSGLNLELTFIPSDVETKLNLSFAAGDYTDVIQVSRSKKQLIQYGMMDGIFVDLLPSYEEYGFELRAIFEENPDYFKNSLAPDGGLYGMPNFNECYHCTAYPKFWLNYTWLEQLGFEEPTTTEELRDLLRAFKTQDPNGNGLADEIPLTAAIDNACPVEYVLLNSFLPVDRVMFCYAKDGTVYFAPQEDAYRDGLEYIKSLFDEGLIDPAAFTQNSEQLTQTVRQDPLLVGGYTCDHIAMGIDLDNTETTKMFHALPPVEGPTGAKYQPQTGFVDMNDGFGLMVTDKCENVDAAFRYGDMFYGIDVDYICHFGKEGDFWGKLDAPVESAGGGMAEYWARSTFSDAERELFFSNVFYVGPSNSTAARRNLSNPVPEDIYAPDSYEARLTMETNRVVDYFYPEYLPRNIYIDPDVVDEFDEIKLNLVEYVKMYTVQFIVGEKSIDNDWASFIGGLNGYGMERYIELYQQAFDNYNNLD